MLISRQQESRCWAETWNIKATWKTQRCSTRRPWSKSWDQDARHRQWGKSWKNWGRHGLQNSRTTTFNCEAIAECQRSKIESEDREPPESLCSSTKPTTESIIWSLQSRIKTYDSWSWEHRTVWITRHGTQNEVQKMFIILGNWHRLLHVRALLAKGREENQKIVQYTMDLHSIPEYYTKEVRPRGHRYGKKPRDKEHDIHNQLKEEVQKVLPGFPWASCTRWTIPQSNDWNWTNRRSLSPEDDLANKNHTHHLTPQE